MPLMVNFQNRKMRKNYFILAILIIFSASLVFAKGAEKQPAAASVYAYSEDDIPGVCFFPVSKARWDGTLVTVLDWTALTDFMKFKFVDEYMKSAHPKANFNLEKYVITLDKYANSVKGDDLVYSMAKVLEASRR